ncbi:MAG: leucine-rich repeat domain-containing protein [Pontiellaceae bacterium]|nr:leucine-rich repeat domain-containing protein [Pontiellaceae bacterium]
MRKWIWTVWLMSLIAMPVLADTLDNLTYTNNGTSITITGYITETTGILNIPATINGKPVTSIEDYAFLYCRDLTSVTIPSSVTNIGRAAFQSCSDLTSVSVDAGNPNYSSADGVLFNKLQTTLIEYPEGKSGAIYTIPSSVTSIGNNAFSRSSGLTSVTIPSSVTNIATGAFSWCSGLRNVTIPSSVTSIGNSAFGSCSGLTSITIPSSVTNIGNAAFYDCGLTSITIPSSVTRIGDRAFESCGSLMSVTIPSSVTSMGDSAFKYCSGLTSVTIPSGVTSIGDSVFSWCRGLTSVTIPSSVTNVGDSAFYYCRKLTSVTIPSNVTSIGDSAFSRCSGLTSITIPSSVTSIGDSAFQSCSGLTSITIPSSVTNIGDYAFQSCSDLTSVTVDAANPTYSSADGVLLNKLQTTLIKYPASKTEAVYTIPSSVTNIGESAFSQCSGLTNIIIPSSVTNIGQSAFSQCSGLTSITIPSSVTSIGGSAFSSCSGLAEAIFEGNAPIVFGSYVFFNASDLFSIYFFELSTGFTEPTWMGYPSEKITMSGDPSDADSDGIPDEWEQAYFGSATGADPSVISSNGINTVLECYIVGLDPNDSQACFRVDSSLEDMGVVLYWNTLSGRVYSVWQSTNLLSSFECLESNLPWTISSYTNNAELSEVYFKIKVELE